MLSSENTISSILKDLVSVHENLLTLSKYERERKEKEPVSQLSLF